MRKLSLLALLSCFGLVFINSGLAATRERPALIQIDLSSRQEVENLQALGLDIIELQLNEYVKILVSDEDLQTISEAGYSYRVLSKDLTAELQFMLAGQQDMGGYHTLSEIYAALDSIHNEHPTITTARDSIGYTIQGRAIYALKISDNPEVDEDEPEVFFNALTHAREPMGMEVLLYFMRYLTDNYGSDARVDSIVNHRELWFVPLCNPDGYFYNELIAPGGGGLWRKNRKNNGNGSFGVDLNRNYGHKWGYNNIGSSPNTSSEVYRGTGPFSEPETQAMRDFVLNRDFIITINYHTYSDLLLYAWGYTSFQPPDRLVYEVLAETATSVNNYVWGPGYSTIYPTNGDADDWMYGEQFLKQKSLSFTPEVGSGSEGGFWPPANLIPVMCAENLEANLLCAELAGDFSNRSFWSLATEPVFFDTLINWGDSLVLPLTLYNHGNHGPVYLKAQSTESPDWLMLEPENTDTSVTGADTLVLNVKLTYQNLSLGGIYYSEIQLLSYNSITPAYRDTTLIPVRVEVICSGAQLPGDEDGSGNWSLADVIHLINFVFDKDRPANSCLGADPGNCWTPVPLCRGEVDGNPPIGLPDVIHLVNYVFDKDRSATGCMGSSPGNCWLPVPTDVCCLPGP